MKTNEGAFQYEHSLNHCVEFFSKAGSLYDTDKPSFYSNKEDILSLFQRSWITNKEISFKLLLWLRDCRGGAGNRSGFRRCLKWLAKRDKDSKWISENIELISKYGRFDDLRSLFKTNSESEAVSLWIKNILNKNVLAAKWAKRTDIPLFLKLKDDDHVRNMGDFRRLLSSIRSEHIIETKMCSNKWDEINYKAVPSVAMSRFSNAFIKHDMEGFTDYKNKLANKETTINSSVLFPHDCVRNVKNGDVTIANEQFESLPNYIGDNKSIMVLSDSSGSMVSPVSRSKSITAFDVTCGLALYCSSMIPKDSPFHKKFIQFCSESKLTSWEGLKFSEAICSFDGAVGSTRIDLALKLLLNIAKMFAISDDNMPKMLLICSDMQFSVATKFSLNEIRSGRGKKCDEPETLIERELKNWDESGYSRPKIVYWNLCPYVGQPETVDNKNIALISGFSPSILKSVLSCDDLSPINVMMMALEKYDITIPKE